MRIYTYIESYSISLECQLYCTVTTVVAVETESATVWFGEITIESALLRVQMHCLVDKLQQVVQNGYW